jgi:hypothetical protein
MNVGLAIFFILIINLGIIAFLFFTIKYFIRYSIQLKKKKSQQQVELDRMNVEDL